MPKKATNTSKAGQARQHRGDNYAWHRGNQQNRSILKNQNCWKHFGIIKTKYDQFPYFCALKPYSMSWLESLGLLGLFIGTFLAATIVPFSSDALYIAVLVATKNPVACLIVGTLGNWLGSVTTYWLGRIGKWEWIEKWFKVKPETLERQRQKVNRYGIWLALLAWVPIVGDLITLALGFYKAKPLGTIVLLLVGKFLRFLVWNLLIGAF